MTQRLDYKNASPKGFAAMLALELHARASGLEHGLLELVKTRVSQLNGCAFCLDMHTKDARAAGEGEQRLYLLPAWREAPCYTERERAALSSAGSSTRPISPLAKIAEAAFTFSTSSPLRSDQMKANRPSIDSRKAPSRLSSALSIDRLRCVFVRGWRTPIGVVR